LLGCQLASAQLAQPGVNPAGKNYWRGLQGLDSLSISRVWTGSLVVPGYSQFYNRDYWKAPVVWAGMGGFLWGGLHSNKLYNATGDSRYRTQRDLCYVGMAAVYWGSLVDGLVSYNTGRKSVPQRATLYSVMLPGLGQAYNGDYWKIPIVYGALAFTAYLVDFNSIQYLRFRTAYNIVSGDDPDAMDEFNRRYSVDQLRYYRDQYRRSRDYAIFFTVLVYALNVIDANVFAYLKDFDVSDNLSFRMQPAMMRIDNFASSGGAAVGMKINFTF